MFRQLIAALAIVAMILPNPAFAQTTLSVLHAFASHSPWQQELAKRYTALHPDVAFSFQVPADTYDNALVSVIRQSLTGEMPDIYLVGAHLLPALVARGLVEPVDDLLAGADLASEGYAPETLAMAKVDGKLYGLPWTSSTPVVFFNQDLVVKAGGDPKNIPKDWNGLIALAGKIDALAPDVMGMYFELGTDDWMTQNLLRSENVDLVSADGKTLAFDTPQGVAAVDLFRRFHTEGGQEPIDQPSARQQMYAGKMGFYFVSTAAVRSFDREIGKRFTWGTAPIPLVNGGGVVSGGMVAVILSKDPTKRKAAFDYIRFGTGAESQAFIVQNTGYMPVNLKAVPMLDAFYAEHPAWKTSVLQLPNSRPLLAWSGENGVRISQAFVDGMTALANGQTDAAQTVAALAEQVKALLPR
jgi:multiple sugar transport system substrate-binding protein